MKTFKRGDTDCFAVFMDELSYYRIGLFNINIFTNEVESKPYHTHKAKFSRRKKAEDVCEMLQEEYNDGISDGQGSCY
jgi:hypothetical protein